MLAIDASIASVKGIGEKRFLTLKERGLTRVEDLLLYLPRRYEERGRIQLLREAQGEAEVLVKIIKRKWWKGKKYWVLEAEVEDSSGKAKVLWFNRKYLLKVVFPGSRLYLKGKVERSGSRILIKSPEVRKEWESGVIPIYERIGPLTSRVLHSIIKKILISADIKENLPASLIEKYGLPSRRESFLALHLPDPSIDVEKFSKGDTPFHRRLIFEEAFNYYLSIMYLRKKYTQKKNRRYAIDDRLIKRIKDIFPFQFTQSQQRALGEIIKDLNSVFPMRRLLQGDVGSGKTAVAVTSGALVALSGYQVAFMAPTEILATQHFKRLSPMLYSLGIHSELIVGGMRTSNRKKAEKNVGSGKAGFVFGTHALFYDNIEFKNLAFAIVDEQHRFGVAQRAKLYKKGMQTDILLLSATPIPRTLALVLYSDLKLSTLKEMPRPRKVFTRAMKIKEFKEIVPHIKGLIEKGIQGFAVFPVIEKSKTGLIDAENGMRRLMNYFPQARIELLHGKMSSEEKATKMEKFEKGEIDLLVSTTVVEVGIDIEMAGFMLVFNAERFGLAQLHQLRGRIGRGKEKGYFFMFSDTALERLKLLEKTDDGFQVAEWDLKLRGPGNLAGKQQWGIPRFRLLDPFLHRDLLETARKEAESYLIFMEDEISNIIKEEITIG